MSEEHPLTRKYREYAAISDAYQDAPLPEGYESHAAYLLEKALATGKGSRGYALYELHFLANEGQLLPNHHFEQARARGEPIPYDLEP
jgi:hypothetical protein